MDGSLRRDVRAPGPVRRRARHLLLVPVALALAAAGYDPALSVAGDNIAAVILLLIAFAPLVASLGSLFYPVGAGRLWRLREGGRHPSERERAVFEIALATLRERDPRVRAPGSWFVLDDWALNAAVLGDTIMVSTGTLHSPELTAVLAHELGHLNTSDAYLTAALSRMSLPATLYHRAQENLGDGLFALLFRLTGWVCSGEIGVAAVQPFWDAWFRSREFKADQYAARLGQARQLADALEYHALGDDRPIPYRFLSGASHPSTEHRIDALNHAYLQGPQPTHSPARQRRRPA